MTNHRTLTPQTEDFGADFSAEDVLNMHPRNLRLADITQSNAFQEKHILEAMEEYAQLYHASRLKQIAGEEVSDIDISNESNSPHIGLVNGVTAAHTMGALWLRDKLAPKIAAMKEKYGRLYEENAGQYLDLHQAKNTIAQLQAESTKLKDKADKFLKAYVCKYPVAHIPDDQHIYAAFHELKSALASLPEEKGERS